jgi:hypothetical protein
MSESWQGNFQIQVSGKLPQTSHGPALVVFNGQLHMVYIGGGGNNIWHSWTVGEQLTNWTGNQQIVFSGQVPKSVKPVALAVANNMLHMVYVGEGGVELYWSWFDGVSWHGNLNLNTSLSIGCPCLVNLNGQLHLLYNVWVPIAGSKVGSEGVAHLSLDVSKPLVVTSWEQVETINLNFVEIAAAAFNSSIYIVDSGNQVSPLYFSFGTSSNWSELGEVTGPNGAAKGSRGSALAASATNLHLIYVGASGSNIWHAVIDQDNSCTSNVQIITPAGVPTTDTSINGAAIFAGALCTAYKGSNSDDIRFSFLTGF